MVGSLPGLSGEPPTRPSLTSGTATGDGSARRETYPSKRDTSATFAAATAAAIAAGPSALVASVSDMSTLPPPAPLPRLELRGCTPTGGVGDKSSRFEINLGQQIRDPSSLEWEVTLVRPVTHWLRRGSPCSGFGTDSWRVVHGVRGSGARGGRGGAPLQFRLYTLHRSDAEWLTLGRQGGQLMEAETQVRPD